MYSGQSKAGGCIGGCGCGSFSVCDLESGGERHCVGVEAVGCEAAETGALVLGACEGLLRARERGAECVELGGCGSGARGGGCACCLDLGLGLSLTI